MRDFTVKCFELLCETLDGMNYEFITFSNYCLGNAPTRFVILRHDVDACPKNALRLAILEKELEIKASFYFRKERKGFRNTVISRIAKLGHEVGYHYEDLSTANGRLHFAIELFKSNLSILRSICPVTSICMHGSPMSHYDNRWIWHEYDYKDFGIAGDVYLDTDFSRVQYFTDTGRTWNGQDFAVRDKVNTKHTYPFRSTYDIIRLLRSDIFPKQLMINIHPQRWSNNMILWTKELIWQNVKNLAKKYVLNK